MTGWWAGTRLVAARTIRESVSARSWRLITLAMFLIGLAAVIIPRLIGDDTTTYRLATIGETPPSITAMLVAAGQSADFEVDFSTAADDSAAERMVRDGDVDVALTATGPQGTMYVAAHTGGVFPALVAQAAVADSTTGALRDAGLTDEQIAAIQSTTPPRQVEVGRATDEGRAGVGFATGIVLYIALLIAGTTIATAVATEKSSRISEVLLAVLRPTQLLVGTVLGVGALMLVQIGALALPVIVGMRGSLHIPASASVDVALAVLWFVLGLAMYAFVYAALGALVDKPTEVGSATMPANALLIGAYLLAVTVTIASPNSWVSVAASIFPLSAPMVMPIRWASGLVPVWQLVLAMALTLATAVVLARFAARIYQRGLTLTGRRVKLREVMSS